MTSEKVPDSAAKAKLRSGRWFAALEPDLQDAFISAGMVRAVTGGTRLFSRGDEPNGLFAMLEGAVRITATTNAGREALLTLAEPPTWFGEISVIDGQPRTHDAIVEADARLFQVPQTSLEALLARDGRGWRALGRLVSHKLRLALIALEDAAVLPVAVRLARRLLMMTESYGEWNDRTLQSLEVKQEQLAGMLSTSRQTVNGLLKDLESKGVVRLSYGHVEVLDLAALRLAAGV